MFGILKTNNGDFVDESVGVQEEKSGGAGRNCHPINY